MWLRLSAFMFRAIAIYSSRLHFWSSSRHGLMNGTVRQDLFVTISHTRTFLPGWILLLRTSFGEQMFVSLFSNCIFLLPLQFFLYTYLIRRWFFYLTTVWATKTSVNLVLNVGFLVYETLLLFLRVEFLNSLGEKHIFFQLFDFL